MISIISATPNPIDTISRAAGTCYGKDDGGFKRVKNCYKAGHDSVLEHASVTFRAEGISRACANQLVRHRLASYCQESQRYVKVDVGSNDWYVMPPVYAEMDSHDGRRIGFENLMWSAACEYELALNDGIKPEDARYMLPEATKTAITVTMNVRSLFHLFDLRLDKAAQWEIRQMAGEVKEAVSGISLEWKALIKMWEEEHEDHQAKR